MDKREFSHRRKELGKTQKQLAQLLGISLKTVHSYEQGWRNVPSSVERQLLFLISMKRGNSNGDKACWTIKKCPPKRKKQCPAWEFQAGTLCWFINGTICGGIPHKTWEEKIELCRTCEVFTPFLEDLQATEPCEGLKPSQG
jgi:hypothetical protein